MQNSPMNLPLLVRAAFLSLLVVSSISPAHAMRLSELLRELDTASPHLSAAKLEMTIAQTAFTASRGWPNPTLIGGQEILGANEEPVETTIGVEQELGFLWSQRSRLNARRCAFKAARAMYDETRETLISEVVINAYEYDGILRQEQALDSLIAKANRLMNAVSARQELGDLSQYDKERFSFLIVQLQKERIELTVREQEAIQKLVDLTGLSDKELAPIELDYHPAIPEEGMSDDFVRVGLQNRAVVQATEQRLQQAGSELHAARASQIPGLSIAVGRKSIEDGDSGLFWEAGLEIPLFNQRRSDANRAKARLRNSEIEDRAIRQTVTQEILGALKQRDQVELSRGIPPDTLRKHADQNIDRGALLYFEGELSVFELVDVLSSGYDAQVSAIEMRNASVEADVKLLRALGIRLLENTDD